MCATQRDKFIISEKNGPDYLIVFILLGVLKDDVYSNFLHNEGNMKWNAEWCDMSWNKKLSHSKWGMHYLLPCPAEIEIERLFKNGVRMWGTYLREFVVSEEVMGPKVLVAFIAHYIPTVMSDNGS
jgi:hypothetical protein